MFDIGWTELLVIAIVAIVVVGPRELPGMLRNFGRYAGQMRRMAGDFQRQFNDALKEADLDDVRKGIESVRSVNPLNDIKDSLNPLKDAGNSIRKAIEDPGAPKPGAPKPGAPKVSAPKVELAAAAPEAPAAASEPPPAAIAVEPKPKAPSAKPRAAKAPAVGAAAKATAKPRARSNGAKTDSPT